MNKKFIPAIQTSRYNNLSFQEELDFAIKNKVDAFEIFFDDWSPYDITPKELSNIMAMKQNGMIFSIHAPIRDYLTKKDLEEVYPLLDFCKKIEACLMTIHFDRLNPDLIDELVKRLKINTHREVKLSIENTIPDKNIVTGQKYIEFMSTNSCKYHIFGTIDIGHAVVNGYNATSFIEAILQQKINIDCFHIHNNDGIHDLHQDITKGIIDYDNLLTYIFKNDIEANFVIEHWNNNMISINFFKKILTKSKK